MRVLIVLALSGAAFAVPRNPTRIVGGSPTTVEQYPYIANMQYGLFGVIWYQACGGSLLSPTVVLSAAHCYDGDHHSEWRVRLGSSFRESGGSLHSISQLIIHPNYTVATNDPDVVIVRLATPAVYSSTVGPARIAGSNYNLADGTVVTAIGWGTLSSGGPSPDILQHVDVNIINHRICTERYAYLKTQPGFQNWPDVTEGMLCAGILDVGGKDACQGDSGGPLAHNGDVIVGVTSWAFECGDTIYPGVNARVSAFSSWIAENA